MSSTCSALEGTGELDPAPAFWSLDDGGSTGCSGGEEEAVGSPSGLPTRRSICLARSAALADQCRFILAVRVSDTAFLLQVSCEPDLHPHSPRDVGNRLTLPHPRWSVRSLVAQAVYAETGTCCTHWPGFVAPLQCQLLSCALLLAHLFAYAAGEAAALGTRLLPTRRTWVRGCRGGATFCARMLIHRACFDGQKRRNVVGPQSRSSTSCLSGEGDPMQPNNVTLQGKRAHGKSHSRGWLGNN